MIRILTIIGARPQFIKAATITRAFSQQRDVREIYLLVGNSFPALLRPSHH